MRRFILPFALAGAAAAQIPTDAWAFGSIASGKLAWITADLQTLVVPTPQSSGMSNTNALAVDDAGQPFYGSTTGGLYRVVLAGSTVVQEVQLANAGGAVSGVGLRGNQLWYVLSTGDIGFVDRTTPNQTPTVVYNFKTAQPVQGNGNAMCTDGREIFVGTSGTADPYNIWALDVSGPVPSWRGVALVQVPGSSSNTPAQMNIGRDGKVVVATFGGWFAEVDPQTGAYAAINSIISPQGRLNAGSSNPWTNVLGGGTGATSTPRQVDFYDVAAASWAPNVHSFTDVPAVLTAACEPPFTRFGRGCNNATGGDARIGFRGLPQHGGSFTLTVDGAEPAAIGLLWLGLSSRSFGPLPLPLDLQPFGAPGCQLLVSLDAQFVTVLQSGSGSVVFPVPNLPALGGMRLFAQWACTTTANALGLAPSDALQIRMR